MLQTLSSVAALVVAASMVSGLPVPDGTWPVSKGSVKFEAVHLIKAGEVFDGKMQTFDRTNITCLGQEESGQSTAVFQLEANATLKNAIIGKNQMEGVHCDDNDCTIDNVWWDDVCEDALSIKGGDASSVSRVLGGGARYADDKVIQHNGLGTVIIDGFYAQDFGKLYRSCGSCSNNPAQRFLNMRNVFADLEIIQAQRVDPNVSIVMMNENYGDEAVLHNIYVKPGAENYTECGWSRGVQKGDKPLILGNGPKDPVCQYTMDEIHLTEGDRSMQQDQVVATVHPAKEEKQTALATMDKLVQLQAALRAIETGKRLESVDNVLVRQVLLQPRAQPQQATREHDARDIYRELQALRKAKAKASAKQNVRDNESSGETSDVGATPPSPKKTLAPAHHHCSVPVVDGRLESAPSSPERHSNNDNELVLSTADTIELMQKAFLTREKELKRSEKAVARADAELREELSRAEKILPSKFLFERNLAGDRALEAARNVLLRFQHRFYQLYFRQWWRATLELRLQAQRRAVAEIVRVYRGHRGRQEARRLRRELSVLQAQERQLLAFRMKFRSSQATKLQMAWRRYLRHRAIKYRQARQAAARLLQQAFRTRQWRGQSLVNALANARKLFAVVAVQKLYRGHRTRCKLAEAKRRQRQEARVQLALLRNMSKQARAAWMIERCGAGYLIAHRAIFPYAMRLRWHRAVYQLRRQAAAECIARAVCKWFGVEVRREAARAKQVGEWLALVQREHQRSRSAAVLIQKHLRRWVQQRKFLMAQARRKKLARKTRLAEKARRLEQTPQRKSPGWLGSDRKPPVATSPKRKPSRFMSNNSLSPQPARLMSFLKPIPLKDGNTKAARKTNVEAAALVQRNFRRYCARKKARVRAWKHKARTVEARVLQRRKAATEIQRRVRGIAGRTLARRRRAERLLKSPAKGSVAVETFSSVDVDVAVARATAGAKGALDFAAFVRVIGLLGEISLAQQAQSASPYWGRYDGTEARVLALLWRSLLPHSSMQPLVLEFEAYVSSELSRHAACLQRLFARQHNKLHGAAMLVEMRRILHNEALSRAAVVLQTQARKLLARRELRRRMKETYEKFLDPTWGLPYWMNPRSGYSTWQKPRLLGAEDVCCEPVPFPPPERTLKASCNGKKNCDRCAEWVCYDCDEFFCLECFGEYHKSTPVFTGEEDSKEGNDPSLEKDENVDPNDNRATAKREHELERLQLSLELVTLSSGNAKRVGTHLAVFVDVVPTNLIRGKAAVSSAPCHFKHLADVNEPNASRKSKKLVIELTWTKYVLGLYELARSEAHENFKRFGALKPRFFVLDASLLLVEERRLSIRARFFGLLIDEYVTVGVPLPGLGLLHPGSNEIWTSEDLRGWIRNRQTIRLKKLSPQEAQPAERALCAWRQLERWGSAEIEAPEPESQGKDAGAQPPEATETSWLVDTHPKQAITERMVPLAQSYDPPLPKTKRRKAAGEEEEVVEDVPVAMFLVEFSLDPKRTVWINHSLAERFWEWKRLKLLARSERTAQRQRAKDYQKQQKDKWKQHQERNRQENGAIETEDAPPGVESSAAVDAVVEQPWAASNSAWTADGAATDAYYNYNYYLSTDASTAADGRTGYDGYSTSYPASYDYGYASTAPETAPPVVAEEATGLVDSENYYANGDYGSGTSNWYGTEYSAYEMSGYSPAATSSDNSGWASYSAESQLSIDPNAWYANTGDASYNWQQSQPAQDQGSGTSSHDSYSIDLPSATNGYYDPYTDDQQYSTPQSEWEEVFDPATQQTYYVNRVTNETAWQLP
uniref:Probable pectate lyase F n=1 Tax=Phytophthora ramorum TaxID=164328 RepID=H3GY53_PHYRM